MSGPEHSSSETEDRSGYWDEYYAARATVQRPLPSQFAAFVAGELDQPYQVIEFGCGTGRDSIFFSSFGHDVTGVDASEQAVKAGRDLADALGERTSFLAARIDDPDLASRLDAPSGPRAIYARFFVHAITDGEERAFLELAAALTSSGDILAVEYRTIRDSSGAKVTERHYRRFVTPATVQARALSAGFDVTYAVEGFGFAKYKQDDAYVARALFMKR